MGVLPGAEGVPVNIELSINRCWPRTREHHCHCSGAVVQWSCMRWSCGQTRGAGWWRRVKAAVSRFPWVKVPLIGPEHSILHYSPSYPRQAATALPQDMRLPHKVGSNVERVGVTQHALASNRDRCEWRSLVMSTAALFSNTTVASHKRVLSNLSGCREHGHVL